MSKARKFVLFFLTAILVSTVVCGQTDTLEWKDSEGRQLLYFKGSSFNSALIILDSLRKDTLEFDRQISKNKSLSIIYENNKPKYKIYCKAHYDKSTRKTRREERHHNYLHLLNDLHIKRHTCFFPIFYYDKSAKIKHRQIFNNGHWKKCTDKNIKPAYALFDNYTVHADGKIRSKF